MTLQHISPYGSDRTSWYYAARNLVDESRDILRGPGIVNKMQIIASDTLFRTWAILINPIGMTKEDCEALFAQEARKYDFFHADTEIPRWFTESASRAISTLREPVGQISITLSETAARVKWVLRDASWKWVYDGATREDGEKIVALLWDAYWKVDLYEHEKLLHMDDGKLKIHRCPGWLGGPMYVGEQILKKEEQ